MQSSRPGRPEVPRVGVVVEVLLHRDQLVALPTLLERELILPRGPDVETLAHLGVSVEVVEVSVSPVGELSLITLCSVALPLSSSSVSLPASP